jgi:hypothetical protein
MRRDRRRHVSSAIEPRRAAPSRSPSVASRAPRHSPPAISTHAPCSPTQPSAAGAATPTASSATGRDPPAPELDEHEDIERPEPGGLDGEEVAGDDRVRLSPQELWSRLGRCAAGQDRAAPSGAGSGSSSLPRGSRACEARLQSASPIYRAPESTTAQSSTSRMAPVDGRTNTAASKARHPTGWSAYPASWSQVFSSLMSSASGLRAKSCTMSRRARRGKLAVASRGMETA